MSHPVRSVRRSRRRRVMRAIQRSHRAVRFALAALVVLGALGALAAVVAAPQAPGGPARRGADTTHAPENVLAARGARSRCRSRALLGAVLAFRPQRRGTPPRQPAVIQTQIILALVGALVMLVVGASLARAFGIVGAASLVRYRAKVDDPKDAGIMLSCLGLGLASGVGIYWVAAFATLFILCRGLGAGVAGAARAQGDAAQDRRQGLAGAAHGRRGHPAREQDLARAARPSRRRT